MVTRRCTGRAALAAVVWLFAIGAHATDLLDPQDAFSFSATIGDGGKTVEARFDVADGYYLYQDRFGFGASDDVRLGPPQYPAGRIIFDESFNRNLVVHRGEVVVKVPIRSGNGAFTLTAKLQGCADQGVCYPPETRTTELVLDAPPTGAATVAGKSTSATSLSGTTGSRIAAALHSRSLPTVVPIFFVLGLLLSFTPCVLPMLPIVSSIIVGQIGARRDESSPDLPKKRGFALALAYASGMAIVYTALGIAAGLAGEGFAALLQQPWVLALFAGLLVALALSMFGFYELQLPSAWQTYFARASNRQTRGKLTGALVMGAISALIVGPCVAPALAGALLYISQTRDVVIGGSALFALAAGMSVPLLLVGVSAGWLLPRAGQWMESVRRLLGAVMVAVALWTISPLIPAWTQMLSWAALFIIGAGYLRVFDALPADASGWPRLWKGIGIMLLVAGTLEIVGVAAGGRDPLRPLEPLLATRASTTQPLMWSRIGSVEQLDDALASASGKPVLLAFYADWCVSCKEMERFTFDDPRVAARLANFRLLQIDVTANNDFDRALLKRFDLFGPPATIFFDGGGREVPGTRVIGFERADLFLQTLLAIGTPGPKA